MMNKLHNFVLIKPSPLILPASFGLRREPPRRPEDRQDDYLKKFDFSTVYYDVFEVNGVVTGIGPPALNLRKYIDDSTVCIDGTEATVRLVELDRTQVTRFHADNPGGGLLSFDHAMGNISCEIGRDLSSIFEGRSVITTKSKNNAISWICDWARFYVTNHKVTGVVLYDNGSTDYAAADVLNALRDVPGLQACAVVEWAYPWGSPGGVWAGNKGIPWDSDYCQYGAMEHARNRLLRNARIVINHDIDELLVTDSGQTAEDILRETGAAGIEYKGRWIETVGTPVSGEPRFFDFRFYDKGRSACTKKWIVDPLLAKEAAQWKLHSVAGINLGKSDALSHRHFMGINNNWKHNRSKLTNYSSAKHSVDEELSASLVRAFATPVSALHDDSARSERSHGEDGVRSPVTTEAHGFPAYWCEAQKDLGAALCPWLISMIAGREVRNVYGDPSARSGVASIGSSLNFLVNKNLTIWGSGVTANFTEEDKQNFKRYRPAGIRAVRGKLTGKMLSSLGIDVPPIFGDPALLLPRFYNPRISSGGVVICPELQHREAFFQKELGEYQIIGTWESPADVVSGIANATCCISTSLHGLVVAQAYGVPWVWLHIVDLHGAAEDLPFEDFFTVLDREQVVKFDVAPSEIVSLNYRKLADSARLPSSRSRFDSLLDAFPVLQQDM